MLVVPRALPFKMRIVRMAIDAGARFSGDDESGPREPVGKRRVVLAMERYIRTETIFSVVGSTVVNVLFFLLVFGAKGPIEVWGVGKYAFDFVPQSFMTALICVWLPGAITRKRLANGAVVYLLGPRPRPASLILRGLLYGNIALGLGAGAISAALFLSGLNEVNWLGGFVFKLAYGAIVAAIVTPVGLHAVLREVPKR